MTVSKVMSHVSDVHLFLFNFIGICREEIPFWVPFDQKIPKEAVRGGKEGVQTLFIGRAHHCGSVTPGKVLEVDKTCFIPWGCVSNEKVDYELLINNSSHYNWVAAEKGNVPDNAFPAGHSEQGETLYIGRVLYNGNLVVGKIQPSHRVCYIALGTEEINFQKYEVFVV